MDLDFCTVCYRATGNGELYCSDACRLHDTPQDLQGAAGPACPSSPTDERGFNFARQHRMRSFSGSSDDEEDFVTPGKHNLAFNSNFSTLLGNQGAKAGFQPRRPRGAANGAALHPLARAQPLRPGFAPARGRQEVPEDDDAEVDFLAALMKPTCFDHRERTQPAGFQTKQERSLSHYIVKKEFPSAF